MLAEHHIHDTDALTAAVIAAIVESHRPDIRTTDYGAGWNAHRAGLTRAAVNVTRGRVYRPDYLAGWDARHRLACAVAAGMIGVAR